MSKPAYVSRVLWAQMRPNYVAKTSQVQVGTHQVEKRKSLFSSEKVLVDEPLYEERTEMVADGESDTHVDGEKLAVDIESLLNELDRDGYDVLTITPLASGRYRVEKESGTGFINIPGGGGQLPWASNYAWAYSVSDGVIVTARLRAGSSSPA